MEAEVLEDVRDDGVFLCCLILLLHSCILSAGIYSSLGNSQFYAIPFAVPMDSDGRTIPTTKMGDDYYASRMLRDQDESARLDLQHHLMTK